MAAPVGHIICALALLNNNQVIIPDQDAFYAGNLWPDSRYVLSLERKATHQLKEVSLSYVKKADSSFELGRRFHVFVDHKREDYMKEQGAYNFIENGPYKTQMLKLVEDNILFDKLKGNFETGEIFDKIYPEEKAYGVHNKDIHAWHKILKRYLDTTSWFNITRFYHTARAYKEAFKMPDRFFKDLWTSTKTFALLLYAYIQIERLSRDEKLRAIVLDFYENKITELINTEIN